MHFCKASQLEYELSGAKQECNWLCRDGTHFDLAYTDIIYSDKKQYTGYKKFHESFPCNCEIISVKHVTEARNIREAYPGMNIPGDADLKYALLVGYKLICGL